jgi:hypothetical protein
MGTSNPVFEAVWTLLLGGLRRPRGVAAAVGIPDTHGVLCVVPLGKSPQLPRPETIAGLGRVAGIIWHRAIRSEA